jgi:hypothetical protein
MFFTYVLSQMLKSGKEKQARQSRLLNRKRSCDCGLWAIYSKFLSSRAEKSVRHAVLCLVKSDSFPFSGKFSAPRRAAQRRDRSRQLRPPPPVLTRRCRRLSVPIFRRQGRRGARSFRSIPNPLSPCVHFRDDASKLFDSGCSSTGHGSDQAMSPHSPVSSFASLSVVPRSSLSSPFLFFPFFRFIHFFLFLRANFGTNLLEFSSQNNYQ